MQGHGTVEAKKKKKEVCQTSDPQPKKLSPTEKSTDSNWIFFNQKHLSYAFKNMTLRSQNKNCNG